MSSMHMSLSYGVARHFGMGLCAAQQIVSVAKGMPSNMRIRKRIGPMPVLDLNRMAVRMFLLGALSTPMLVFADPAPTVRLSPAIRGSAPAQSAPDGAPAFIYPAGCYDAAGRPVNPDPANPGRTADPACQPPSGAVVQERRSAPGGEGSMERGSINLPPLPVPVPDGIGVMR